MPQPPAQPGQPDAEVLWRSFRRWEKMALVPALAFLIGGFAINLGWWSAALQLLFLALAGFLGLRLFRRVVRVAIWRLRNRLLVAYAFVAVAPVVLILLTVGVVQWIVVGQVATYLATTEMERYTARLISTAQRLAAADSERRAEPAERTYSELEREFPGVSIWIDADVKRKYPPDAAIEPPPAEWGDAGGLLIKDGLQYVWAHIVRPDARVTLLLPVTTAFLARLAPNIGEVSLVPWSVDKGQVAGPVRLHRLAARGDPSEVARQRMPDKYWRFDVEVFWGALVPMYRWDAPGRIENEVLSIRTRPSAVIRAVFAEKSDLYRDSIAVVFSGIAVLFLMALISSIVIGSSITRTITGAVHDLYDGTERVQQGDFSHRIQIKGEDQLASLGQSFNAMTAHMRQLLAIEKDNERLKSELEIAREVQDLLYPRSAPAFEPLCLKAACNPARVVSGDYYDYQQIDPARVAIALGDVAGKGISAALLMATIQSAFRTQLRNCQESARPVTTSGLVSQLNQHLYAHTAPEKYATFCLCVFDADTGTLTYTNAGHLPPILVRGDQVLTLEVNGIVVGAFPFAKYDESRIQLEKGDMLLFYTDGVTEPENAYGEQYGEERLTELLKRSQGRPPEQILEQIVAAVKEWTGSPELQDDMTLVVAVRS